MTDQTNSDGSKQTASGSHRTVTSLLDLAGVTKHFGGLAAVDDVTFSLPAGQIKGLIGPNGAGKTTLLNLITGLVPLTAGDIRLDGVGIAGRSPHQIARAGIARTYQNIRLFEEMTVLENILVGQHTMDRSSWLSTVLLLPAHRREERRMRETARGLLERMGMIEHENSYAGELAYGDQRRVEIMRAIASGPKLLLLDEPSAGMNEAETEAIGDFILALQQQGISIMIIEHDMNLISQVCDEVVVLNFGKVIAEGTPAAVKGDPIVIEAYLGEEATT